VMSRLATLTETFCGIHKGTSWHSIILV
jgi:hypothetical protein